MTRIFGLAFTCLLFALIGGTSCRAEGYVLSPDDQIDISVLGHDEFKAGVTLLPDGTFYYPLLGRVHAAGQTIEELTGLLAQGLSRQLNQPQVTVTLREGRPRKVSVLGSAAKLPGQYDCRIGMHLLDLIAVSGGPMPSPELAQAILVISGGSQTISVDLPKLLSHADMTQNLLLAPGDVLFLTPRAASETQVQVVGEVAKPGAYETPPGGISLMSLMNLAGGATLKAALTQAQVMHLGQVTVCNLRPLLTQDLSDAMSAIRLLPGDVLLIPVNNAHILTLGEVGIKGVFPIPDGETLPLTVALAQAGGITADGDKKHISIVRRRVEGAVVLLSVNMDDLVSGKHSASDPRLEPGDILYVPLRRHSKSIGDVLTSLSPLAFLGTLSHL
jgi:protein involved in polysaccharide export with SLBB domain